jgi:hypothetical protein
MLTDGPFLEATKELPDEFPFNKDANSGNPLGFGRSLTSKHIQLISVITNYLGFEGWSQYSVGGGTRASSATGYLLPALERLSNLDVLINAHVKKLMKTGVSAEGLPEIRGFQFQTSRLGLYLRVLGWQPNVQLILRSIRFEAHVKTSS